MEIKNVHKGFCETPIGFLEVKAAEYGILSVRFVDEKGDPEEAGAPPVLFECMKQLEEYFEGKRKTFTVDLILRGTDFQKNVWEKMLDIPYGKTASYGGIAERAGKPNAARAVGMAAGRNNIGIIIPCHRVVGARGNLVGFGGGLWRKKRLLEHEQENL